MSSYSWLAPDANVNTPNGSLQQDQVARLFGKDVFFNGNYAVSASGDYLTVEGIEALRAAVYRRLITRQGELKHRPEYGVGITDYIKKRRTPATLSEIKQKVTDQLSYDPRISETKNIVASYTDLGIILEVSIVAAGRTLQFQPFEFRDLDRKVT